MPRGVTLALLAQYFVRGSLFMLSGFFDNV